VVSRLNRFTVIVDIDGKKNYAYTNNTGRLGNLLIKGNLGLCLSKKRGKLRYLLFALRDSHDKYAIIDTRLQMKTFEYLVNNHLIPWLYCCKIKRRDVKILDSKIDFLIKCRDKEYYTEVKSAVLRINGYASYPDCPSIRGRRHIMTLINIRKMKMYSLILFIAGLPGVKGFKPNSKADPIIHSLLKEAISNNVLIKAISMYFDTKSKRIVLENLDLPVYI